MKELPHQPADTSTADTALAAARGVPEMLQGIAKVEAAAQRQMERVAVASDNSTVAAAASAAAARVLELEQHALDHLERALASHRGTVAAKREGQRRDRETAERARRDEAQRRKRRIEAGLIKLGETG